MIESCQSPIRLETLAKSLFFAMLGVGATRRWSLDSAGAPRGFGAGKAAAPLWTRSNRLAKQLDGSRLEQVRVLMLQNRFADEALRASWVTIPESRSRGIDLGEVRAA